MTPDTWRTPNCCAEIVQVQQAFKDHVEGSGGRNHRAIEEALVKLEAGQQEMNAKLDHVIDRQSLQLRWQYMVMGGIAFVVFVLSVWGRDLMSIIVG